MNTGNAPGFDVDHGEYRRYLAGVTLFHVAAAEAVGLSGTDYHASNLLDLDGPMSNGELAGRLGLSTGATTRLVDRLIAEGVAVRAEDPLDRRRTLIAHSGRAPEDLTSILRRVREPIGRALAQLSPDQLSGVNVYLAAATDAYTAAARELR